MTNHNTNEERNIIIVGVLALLYLIYRGVFSSKGEESGSTGDAWRTWLNRDVSNGTLTENALLDNNTLDVRAIGTDMFGGTDTGDGMAVLINRYGNDRIKASTLINAVKNQGSEYGLETEKEREKAIAKIKFIYSNSDYPDSVTGAQILKEFTTGTKERVLEWTN